MVTKEQFDAFKDIYDQELKRYSELGTRANVYLTLITFIFAAVLLGLDGFLRLPKSHWLLMSLFVAACLVFSTALLLTIRSVFIADYRGWFDPSVVKDEIENNPNDKQFLDRRVAELIKSTGLNFDINKRRAGWLKIAGVLLAIGYVCILLFLLAAALFTSSP